MKGRVFGVRVGARKVNVAPRRKMKHFRDSCSRMDRVNSVRVAGNQRGNQ